MTHDNQIYWPYPGSRWWKFDFHTHTPASADTKAWHEVAGTEREVTPKIWLHKFMQAGIDCLAVTDHNSGDWIDELKDAYAKMLEEAQAGSQPDGFRELTLFPGEEISVSGGIHLLAILDPDQSSSDIDSLLGRVDYTGTKGDSNGVTRASLAARSACSTTAWSCTYLECSPTLWDPKISRSVRPPRTRRSRVCWRAVPCRT